MFNKISQQIQVHPNNSLQKKKKRKKKKKKSLSKQERIVNLDLLPNYETQGLWYKTLILQGLIMQILQGQIMYVS